MPYIIPITVTRKRAVSADPDAEIVCGNGDYLLSLTFDSEWDSEPVKTVRFVWQSGGQPVYADVLTDGDTAAVPVLSDTPEVAVGVYAGNIRTTTPARIPCERCITDGAPVHDNPPPDVYDQLLEYLNEIASGGAAPSGQIVIRLSGAAGGIGGQAVVTETEEENGS